MFTQPKYSTTQKEGIKMTNKKTVVAVLALVFLVGGIGFISLYMQNNPFGFNLALPSAVAQVAWNSLWDSNVISLINQYANETDGVDGEDGIDGTDGIDGLNGADGANAHQPINTASWVIHTWTNDTDTYYAAQNGTDGLDYYSSTNASYVLNTAFASGHTVNVAIQEAVQLTTALTISLANSHIVFSTNCLLTDARGGVGTSLITVSGWNIVIDDLKAIQKVGSESSDSILLLYGATNCVINRPCLYNSHGLAIQISNNSYYNTINEPYVGAVKNGVLVDGNSYATPLANCNSINGGLVQVGQADSEYCIKIHYGNLLTLNSVNIETSSANTPVGIWVVSSKGTSIQSCIVGEGNFLYGIYNTGSSSERSIRTAINSFTASLCNIGIFVDYATSTSLTSIRGLNIVNYAVSLTANHLDTTLTNLNCDEPAKLLSDAAKTQTTLLDSTANRDQHFLTVNPTVAGASNVNFFYSFNTSPKDVYISNIAVSLSNAPGSGKTFTLDALDGVNTMTITISESGQTGSNNTGFLWQPSAHPLIIRYSLTAGATPAICTIILETVKVSTP